MAGEFGSKECGEMKLAVFTDEVSQDLETALKLAVRYNLDGVELRTVW
ncbi:MAG: hypothetical protein GTN78_10215, partial [Gemmatimonadales bacterium]|nr:hypothetical protein [Gemmatimonadales bacterium]